MRAKSEHEREERKGVDRSNSDLALWWWWCCPLTAGRHTSGGDLADREKLNLVADPYRREKSRCRIGCLKSPLVTQHGAKFPMVAQ